MKSLSQVRNIRDPRRRAVAAQQHLEEMVVKQEQQVAESRKVRDEAVHEMLDLRDKDGNKVYRQADVSRELGLSRSAIAQRFTGK